MFPAGKIEWMSQDDYYGYPNHITLLEANVGKILLVTTLLAPCKNSKADLQSLFLELWHVELDLRNIKITLGMDILRCKISEMCEKELCFYLFSYNLIPLLMSQASLQAVLLSRQLSFKYTLQIWIAWSQRQFISGAKEDTATLFMLIAQLHVRERTGLF